MNRGFMFFESYADVFRGLSDEDVATMMKAMIAFAFDGKEVDWLKPPLSGYFKLMEPNISKSIRRSISGSAGGSKQRSKIQANRGFACNQNVNLLVRERRGEERKGYGEGEEEECNHDGDTLPSENPFSDSYVPSDGDQLVRYAADNIRNLSGDSMDELLSYRDQLPDDVIRLAINIACDNGAPRFSYVRRILEGYVEQGIHSVADAMASNEQFRQSHSKVTDDDPRAREDQWF